jgi:hypothetical protein
VRELLHFIAFGGLVWLATVILMIRAPSIQNQFRRHLNRHSLLDRFKSDRMQNLLKNAGMEIDARKINFIRYMFALICIAADCLMRYFNDRPFTWRTIVIFLVFLLFTSSMRFSIITFVSKILHRQRNIQQDSELISFFRLYENSRSKENTVQFHAFCRRVANHFIHINDQVLELSERAVDENIDHALEWWCKQYSSDHPFIGEIRTIILTTEDMEDQEMAISYLKSQSSSIAKTTSDHYQRRWIVIGDIARVVNAAPSVLTFLMVFAMTILYLMIIRSQMTVMP